MTEPKITREEIEYWRQAAQIASPFVSVNPSFLDAICALALQALDMQPRPMSEEPRTGLLCLFHMPRFNEWHIGRWFPADKSDKDDADGFVTGATTKILASLCDGWLPLNSLPEPRT